MRNGLRYFAHRLHQVKKLGLNSQKSTCHNGQVAHSRWGAHLITQYRRRLFRGVPRVADHNSVSRPWYGYHIDCDVACDGRHTQLRNRPIGLLMSFPNCTF